MKFRVRGDRSDREAKRAARRPELEVESSKTGSSGMALGNSIEVQTTMTHSDITEMEDCIKSLQQTSSVQQQLCQSAMKDKKVTHLEIQKLRGEVQESTSDEDAFKDNNDEKVRHYTGLSCWKLLLLLFTFVEPHLMQHSALTPFQQLLITLM